MGFYYFLGQILYFAPVLLHFRTTDKKKRKELKHKSQGLLGNRFFQHLLKSITVFLRFSTPLRCIMSVRVGKRSLLTLEFNPRDLISKNHISNF